MSWLLAVQPDPAQADAVCAALRGNVTEDIVVAESLDDALSLIDEGAPDVILLPSLLPVGVEEYLVAYLAAMPSAAHVQILGLPVLRRPAVIPERPRPIPERPQSIFPWRGRRQHAPPALEVPGYDAEAFAKDVIAYLAGARTIKRDLALYAPPTAKELERRREPRFPRDEVPWVSQVSFAGERAMLIDVSARGALFRILSRPRHDALRRWESKSQSRPRLVLKLESHSELQASGQVIRCVPVRNGRVPHYEVAFSFDEAVGLHLPWRDTNVPTTSASAPKALPGQQLHDADVEQPKQPLLSS